MARVTLKDIAAEAGVSVMTVSNVVNGNSGRVSPATAELVERIVAARGYVPSGPARSLAARRTRLVGLLLPARADGTSLLGSAHDVSVAGALEAALRARDHHVMLRGVATAADVRDSVARWSLDGLVVMGFTDDEVRSLELPAVPTVLVDAAVPPGTRAAAVRADDADGGRLAGEHLLALGHRRVAFCGPTDVRSQVVDGRLDGLRAALADAGAPAPLVVVANTTYEAGLAAAPAVAAGGVTAVFASADVLAAGIERGLAAAGVRVPDDVAVVGFDDAEIARYVSPTLSTVAQDTAAKGRAAAELVLGLIDDEPGAGAVAGSPTRSRGVAADDGVVHIGVSFVARESTGTVRA
ncbi:LacI family DNA-binding transcriptional regulator [Cellulomonas sp. HZM]|uniref:LacI family DNA-binding transcriptional regulator n=1 Tax=Cellulomonas sp. HZM TaxID=1454010 RepID=UPI00068D2CE3|nr:LacI family DNA-binding transcriptional regulator [Cellulomonas sp. HZM]